MSIWNTFFAVGVGGAEENCKENNYSPQTYCAQVQCHLVLYHNFCRDWCNATYKWFIIQYTNGKNISYALHNNLFSLVILDKPHFKPKAEIKHYLATEEVMGGGVWHKPGGIMKRTGESYTTMLSVFPFITCVYLLPLIYCQRVLCKLLIITGHVV